MLSLAALLQGTKTAREKVWKELVAQATLRDDAEPSAPVRDDRAAMREAEKAAFLFLNEWWVGAIPEPPAGPLPWTIPPDDPESTEEPPA